ncbi:hypothetical protein [Psychrobacter sp. BF1]|uniref:hypothetical protein n=1 Tax=Psychrobacter sp. BF1 TaxID=2821147 RepID=UPI001C4E25FC|nr:hypothetical protein [Psychrobacter sp. BF1]
MSFDFMSGFKPSEEERKKRREQFDDNKAKMGVGANTGQGGLLGAGKLNQQVQEAQIAPTPAQTQMQEASSNGRQQRAQALGQIDINRQERDKTQAAALAQARDVARLPVREQAQAVQQMRAQGQERAGLATTPVAAKPSPNLGVGTTSNMVANQQARRQVVAPQLGIVSNTNASVASNNNVSDKTIADEADALKPVYSDSPKLGFGANSVQRGNPDNKSFGLSVDNNAAVAQPLAPAMGGANGGFGFSVMPPPRKAYGEDSRRAALAMDIKPYKNGMGLTTGQIALKNSILNGDDEKYANEQYKTQMSAAQKLAQEGMTQSGENSRAELSELGANSRASQQLGFDADKFRQTAAQAQQENSLNSRRLDMQQANNDVANHMPKQLNALYDKYAAAETEEQKSAVSTQIQMIKGSNANSDKEYWTSIGGGETLSEDGLTSTKNPDVLLNRNTGETRSIPLEPIDYANDPRAIAIKNNTSLSNEERRKQLEALR